MAECETSESTSNPMIGILLTLLACLCYAFGNCMQRYSLLRQPGERVFGIFNRHLGWLVGAIIYFSANGIYAVALSFAPVSVLAAVFSLTILCNAAIANMLLGDKIPGRAYPGYFLVLLGSIIFALSVEAEVCHFGGEELKEVLTSPSALAFWLFLYFFIQLGIIYAIKFEREHPMTTENGNDIVDEEGAKPPEQFADEMSPPHSKPSDKALLLARLLYPSTLGVIEAAGSLLLKAMNSLFTTLATDEGGGESRLLSEEDEEEDNLGLWLGLFSFGIFIFLGIILWLRLVYARFEITSAFPIEFGTLIFCSVVGGFAVFQDHQYVTGPLPWTGVSAAGASILGGIGIVAMASKSQHQSI